MVSNIRHQHRCNRGTVQKAPGISDDIIEVPSGSSGGTVQKAVGSHGSIEVPSGSFGGTLQKAIDIQLGYFTPPDRRIPKSPEVVSRPPILFGAEEPPSFATTLPDEVSFIINSEDTKYLFCIVTVKGSSEWRSVTF